MTATVVAAPRKTFGIHQTVFVVRCRRCRWYTELPNEPLALAISTNHRCARTSE